MQTSVFQTVASNRATYGANEASWARYSRHCAALVAKLRKQTSLEQKSGKKARAFVPKPVAGLPEHDARHLLLLLYDAERAWATSQALKAAVALDKTISSKSQTRHALLQRLKKAVSHAALLAQLLQKLSAPSLIQAEGAAYHNVLKASYLFEKGDTKSSESILEPLQNARTLLEAITSKAPQMNAQAFAYELLQDVDQMTRIALHRLNQTTSKVASSSEVQKLEEDLNQVEAAAAKQQTDFRFKDKTIAIRHPVLAKAMSQGQVSPKDKTLSALEKKLTILGQGEDLARRLADENQAALERSHSARFKQASVALRQTHDLFLFRLLKLRIQRDAQLVAKSEKHMNSKGNPQTKRTHKISARKQAKGGASIVKLYDGIIASYEHLRELSLVEADLELADQIEARSEWASAQRCFYLARVYGLLSSYDKALLINDHASLCVRQTRTALSLEVPHQDTSEDFSPLSSNDLDDLAASVAAQRETLTKEWYAAKTTPPASAAALDLSDLTLKDEPPVKKPSVFDISFNYVTEFDLATLASRAGGQEVPVPAEVEMAEAEPAQTEQPEPAPDAPKKRGWLGGLWRS